jgi:hypothetical protein
MHGFSIIHSFNTIRNSLGSSWGPWRVWRQDLGTWSRLWYCGIIIVRGGPMFMLHGSHLPTNLHPHEHASPAYGVYISQLIRYARACSTYDQFLVRGSLFTDKLMSQGFQLSRLQTAFRKFYGRYNDRTCPYNLSLGHMLSDMFHTNR